MEEDLRALEALAALEKYEEARPPHGWPSTQRGVPSAGRVSQWLQDWVTFLGKHGNAVISGRRWAAVSVPAWANDLADMVTTQSPDYPANAYLARDPSRRPVDWEGRHAEAVKLTRRAVRAAARSPLFRAALSAEAARLRGEVGATFRCHDHLLRWLRDLDWSDYRPRSG